MSSTPQSWGRVGRRGTNEEISHLLHPGIPIIQSIDIANLEFHLKCLAYLGKNW